MRLIAFYGCALVSIAQAAGATPTFWTANDPFVGKWNLNVTRSTIVDDVKVQALGANKYAFNFEGAPTETVVADGTDQPGLPGTTLAVKSDEPHSLTVVRKQDGKIIVSASWKLAPDGRTLRDEFTGVQPDGSKTTTHYLYKRLSGASGFDGFWESTTPPEGLKLEMGIQPYSQQGLTFVTPGSNKNVVFDGREHAGATEGLTYSGQRRGPRSLQYSENNHGKLERVRIFDLSRDGRTLRETIRVTHQPTPNVFVFERE